MPSQRPKYVSEPEDLGLLRHTSELEPEPAGLRRKSWGRGWDRPKKQRRSEAAVVSCSSTESKRRPLVRSAPPTRRSRPLGSDGSQNSFIAGGDPLPAAGASAQRQFAKYIPPNPLAQTPNGGAEDCFKSQPCSRRRHRSLRCFAKMAAAGRRPCEMARRSK